MSRYTIEIPRSLIELENESLVKLYQEAIAKGSKGILQDLDSYLGCYNPSPELIPIYTELKKLSSNFLLIFNMSNSEALKLSSNLFAESTKEKYKAITGEIKSKNQPALLMAINSIKITKDINFISRIYIYLLAFENRQLQKHKAILENESPIMDKQQHGVLTKQLQMNFKDVADLIAPCANQALRVYLKSLKSLNDKTDKTANSPAMLAAMSLLADTHKGKVTESNVKDNVFIP